MRTKTKEVVNYILQHPKLRGKLTPMKLQKILYFAHGWHIAITGKPLINENVEAWKYGPVVASVYHEFKEYGNTPIQELAGSYDMERQCIIYPFLSGKAARDIIDRVIEVYGHKDAPTLSAMTHAPGSPWEKIYEDDVISKIIPVDCMGKYFENLGQNGR